MRLEQDRCRLFRRVVQIISAVALVVGAVTAYSTVAFAVAAFAAGDDDDSRARIAPIEFSDIYLQPQARDVEPGQGGFDPVPWSVGLKTRFANWVDVQVSVGSRLLLYRPAWSPAAADAVQVIQGRGTFHTLIGDFYGGQFMIPWGLEGLTPDRDLWFPRTLLIENGAIPLIDLGAGFHTESEGFFMNLAGHNGEGAGLSNTDNRMFMTGQWGYNGAANTTAGISLTAGRLGVPDVAQEKKIRGVNAFFGFNIFGLGAQLEGNYVESANVSDSTVVAVASWHADIEHPITDNVNLLARYEQYNPNSRVSSNIQGRGYLGAEIHSFDNASRFFIYLIKNNESQTEIPNDEVRIAWRISPTID